MLRAERTTVLDYDPENGPTVEDVDAPTEVLEQPYTREDAERDDRPAWPRVEVAPIEVPCPTCDVDPLELCQPPDVERFRGPYPLGHYHLNRHRAAAGITDPAPGEEARYCADPSCPDSAVRWEADARRLHRRGPSCPVPPATPAAGDGARSSTSVRTGSSPPAPPHDR